MINIRKRILSVVTVLFITLGFNIPAYAEWKQDATGWWYANGNTYYTGWQEIGGKWYYFDKNGYMLYSTIKDGYFLQSDGTWANGGKEIQKYADLLSDTRWQEKNGIVDISHNIIMDVNHDGVNEMLLDNGPNQARLQVSIVYYDNGSIKVQNIPSGQGGYYGYIKDENVLCVDGAHMGRFYGSGYKINNGSWEKVYDWSAEYVSQYVDDNAFKNCTLNGKPVSEAEFKSFLSKIDKYYYTVEY
ncbi:hypothetical protein OD350_22370 [Clostridium beijerinckii]|uniref:hypothetical protein n=1 Tax=Clostridium beijerinckii TaxID=1520 RepID=UPI00222659B3|nr:hypothetical protein [Clostridium beijerinckii]UYZ34967.1 hypothetical protein OD350_22370 [Clostridium beijerinckii]